MLHHKSLYLFVAQFSVVFSDSHPQTFFGGEHQPAGHFQKPYPPPVTAFQQPEATYQQPEATYHQPSTTYQQPGLSYQQPGVTYQQPSTTYQHTTPSYQHSAVTYKQPTAAYQQSPATYQQPKAAYPNPTATYQQPPNYPSPRNSHIGSDGCAVDYVEKYAEVCLPTFQTDCTKEELKHGKVLDEEKDCYSVSRTICMESEHVEDFEVCAYSYNLVAESAPASTVVAKWVKTCTEESICANTHHVAGGYAAPQYCHEQTKQICHLDPILVPVRKNVTLKLPKPVATCINQPIHLPRLACQQISEERCNMTPTAKEGRTVAVDKCVISVGDQSCQQTVLQLPRQGCLDKVTNVRNIYEVVEATISAAYSG